MVHRWIPVLLVAGGCLIDAPRARAQQRAPAGAAPAPKQTAGRKPMPGKPAAEKPGAEKPAEARPVKASTPTERLFAAIKGRDVAQVRVLLQNGVDPNSKGADQLSALAMAADVGSAPLCEALLDKGARLKPDKGEISPLLLAVGGGHEPVVRLFLERGADPNEDGGLYGTPVHQAALADQPAILEFLISKGGKADGAALLMAAGAGAARTSDALLRHGVDPNTRGEEGVTPLMAAAEKGALPVVELLLKGGAEVNAKDEVGKTAMMHAAGPSRAQVVARLKQAGAREFAPTLVEAVRQGDTRAIRALLAAGADANERDARGRTALFFAVRSDKNVVTALLEKGADPNARDKDGHTPVSEATESGADTALGLLIDAGADAPDHDLHKAIEANDLEAIRQALADGASPDGVNVRGETPLMAVFNVVEGSPNMEVLRLLLARGAKVNNRDRSGQTALHYAALMDQPELLKELLDHGGDPNVADDSGEPPLLKANDEKSEAIIRLLIEHGADVRARSSDGKTVLAAVAGRGSADLLKLVLDRAGTAEINARGDDGITPLYRAATEGRAANVKLLLERGADPNPVEEFSKTTPLLAVADAEWKEGKEYLEVARLLLKHGADPNKADRTRNTPLGAAIRSGHDELVPLLRQAGGKLPQPPKPSAILSEAVMEGDIDLVRALLARGQSPNVADESGYPALVNACMRNNPEMVRLLLARGAKPDFKIVSPEGIEAPTALYEAADEGSAVITRMLLKSGADVNAVWAGRTALNAAVQKGSYDVCLLLLNAGAKLDAGDEGSGDLLMRAAMHTDTRVLKLLLQRGIQPDARSGGMTALMSATQFGAVASVRVLLAAGANPRAVDGSGQTLLMHAAQAGSLELVQLFLVKGVDLNARDDRNRTALSLAEDSGYGEIADLLKRAGAKP